MFFLRCLNTKGYGAMVPQNTQVRFSSMHYFSRYLALLKRGCRGQEVFQQRARGRIVFFFEIQLLGKIWIYVKSKTLSMPTLKLIFILKEKI